VYSESIISISKLVYPYNTNLPEECSLQNKDASYLPSPFLFR
jgi:hypothetical protein